MLFIFEISQKSSLSLIQYALVAGAMSLFYLLLLSLSEHLSFALAYFIAALVPIISISLYIKSVLGSLKSGGLVAIILTALYCLLYSILQLQDYALLVGSALLLVALLALMYVTRQQGEAK